jgi:threonine/homoserine/homoserine lactone efflux protein
MLPAATLASFFAFSILLGLSPGPDNIFVLTQSALQGRRAGIFVTLGLSTGLLFHTALVAFGVAALFQASAIAFTVLKVLGALYLLYLAIGAWRAGASSIDGKDSRLDLPQLYRRGIIMNITNPKVSIFFLAFLPQFADPKLGGLSLQLMSLGAVFMVATLLVFGAVALLAGSLGDWLRRSPNWQQVMNRTAAVVFAGLAVKLLTTSR